MSWIATGVTVASTVATTAYSASQGGGDSASATSTATRKLPDYLQKEAKNAADKTNERFREGGPKFFEGQTYADFTPQQQEYLSGLEARSRAGSPIITNAQQGLADVLGGKYLDPNTNPYLRQTYDTGAGAVQRSLTSQFGRGGRFGSGAHENAAGSAYATLANQLYGGNYQAERDRMQGAFGLAPSIEGMDVTNLGRLGLVGDAYQSQKQRAIDEAKARWDWNQQRPELNLDRYLARLQSNIGTMETTSTQDTPYYQDPTSGYIGAGLGALGSIASAYGGGGGGAGLAGALGSYQRRSAIQGVPGGMGGYNTNPYSQPFNISGGMYGR